jgi:hypothetical protein
MMTVVMCSVWREWTLRLRVQTDSTRVSSQYPGNLISINCCRSAYIIRFRVIICEVLLRSNEEGRGSDLRHYSALAWEGQWKPKISVDSRSSDSQSNLQPSEFKTKMLSLPRHSVSNYETVRGTWIVGFIMVQQAVESQGVLVIETSWSHSDTPFSVGHLWTSDQPDAETSTWQHTTLTRDTHPCPRRDSNSQSQQASGL